MIDGLTKVKAFYGAGWSKRWTRVLTAVAALPGTEGDALLAALARAHKDIATDFEWMKAILGRDLADAVLLGARPLHRGRIPPRSRRGRRLAWRTRTRRVRPKFPHLEAELKQRYKAIGPGPARTMLEHRLAKSVTTMI